MYIYFASNRPEVVFALINVDVCDPVPPVLVARLVLAGQLNRVTGRLFFAFRLAQERISSLNLMCLAKL